jgi:hypothetical protein
MTLSAKRFRKYENLTIDVAAEFCSMTDQRQNGSSFSSLGLAETPEVLNTVLNGNSLSFPMVHSTAPTGQRFASYGSRKLNRSLKQLFWQIIPTCMKQVFGEI